MASTACTGAERPDAATLSRLVDLYERERRMYGEVLELSRRQGEAIRQGRSLEEIRGLLERKKLMLDMITHMEAGQGEARRRWEEHRRDLTGDLPARMQRVLSAVAATLEEILAVEADNDRLFLAFADGA